MCIPLTTPSGVTSTYPRRWPPLQSPCVAPPRTLCPGSCHGSGPCSTGPSKTASSSWPACGLRWDSNRRREGKETPVYRLTGPIAQRITVAGGPSSRHFEDLALLSRPLVSYLDFHAPESVRRATTEPWHQWVDGGGSLGPQLCKMAASGQRSDRKLCLANTGTILFLISACFGSLFPSPGLLFCFVGLFIQFQVCFY